MERKVDLFDSTYGYFEADVLARVRRRTFGEDFGQNSWTTATRGSLTRMSCSAPFGGTINRLYYSLTRR
jgi:hypothetical protein